MARIFFFNSQCVPLVNPQIQIKFLILAYDKTLGISGPNKLRFVIQKRVKSRAEKIQRRFIVIVRSHFSILKGLVEQMSEIVRYPIYVQYMKYPKSRKSIRAKLFRLGIKRRCNYRKEKLVRWFPALQAPNEVLPTSKNKSEPTIVSA